MPESGFHYNIGKYQCIVFSDGTLVSQDSGKEEVFDLNCLFISSGDHKILIDTGCGGGFQSTAGRLVKNLEAEGIKPADIDRIIFTHGHIDHVGGSFDSRGSSVFPGARYFATEREWQYWLTGPESSELQRMFFLGARKNLLPLRDRFDLVKGDDEILRGIRLIAAPGHTPGNIIVDISSGGKRLLCIGDIIHSQIEFTNPGYLSLFDVAPEQALLTRARILADVAQAGTLVFACHFPFPGFGYIRRDKGAFTWQPI